MEKEQACADKKQTPRTPWNKGKLIGAKPPLRPSHVWSIRTKFQWSETDHVAAFATGQDGPLSDTDDQFFGVLSSHIG